jgi:hypothetical protein
MPWCQIMLDDPGQPEERMYKRLVRALPVAGDVMELADETVVVTRVALTAPRNVMAGRPVALVFCRLQ